MDRGAAADCSRTWHRALAYAISGRDWDGLGEQRQPDLSGLLNDLSRLVPGGLDAVRAEAIKAREIRAWPYPVPAELSAHLGAAQVAAALKELIDALGLSPTASRMTSARFPDREEQRLLDERPPHHDA